MNNKCLILLCILILSFLSFSCSSDASEETDDSAKLTGVWQNRITGTTGSCRVTFNSDGTFLRETYDTSINDLNPMNEGTYSLNGNQLTLNIMKQDYDSDGVPEDIPGKSWESVETVSIDSNIALIGFGNIEEYYVGGNTNTLTGTWEHSNQHTMVDNSDVTTEQYAIVTITITTDSLSLSMQSSSNPDQSATADCAIDQANQTITLSNSSDLSVIPEGTSNYTVLANAINFTPPVADGVIFDKQ